MAGRTMAETITLKDGRSVEVRPSQKGDGAKVHAYLTELGESTPFILTFPGDMRSVDAYEQHITGIADGKFYSLSAFDPGSGSIVGNTSFHFGSRVKLAHVAEMGTGVLPGWQGIGLGAWMLNRAIDDMRAIERIEKLELTVMDGNEVAMRMYERAGFEHEGRKKRSIKQPTGEYRDELLMGMWIGD